MPHINHEDGNFDIDLDFGKKGEMWVEELFEGRGKVEVKTERGQWQATGNIAIEIKYKGKPSGISSTDADTWIHLLNSGDDLKKGFIFSVDYLKERIKELQSRGKIKIVSGGDNNDSLIVLVPIREIF